MKDIFLSIFKSTEERLKNPFIGTFLLSILIINWKPISIYLFSNQKIEDKIEIIASKYDSFSNLILLPLIVSIIYIVALPYLMWLFESLTFKSFKERNQNLYKNKIIDLEGKKSIAQSEIELENLKADYKEKADLNRQIESLKNDLSIQDVIINKNEDKITALSKTNLDLEKQLIQKEESINTLYEKLKNNEVTTKSFLDDYENTPKNTIRDFINILHNINKHEKLGENVIFIDRFIALGLIQVSKSAKGPDNENREYIEITEKGLFFIKRAFSSKLI